MNKEFQVDVSQCVKLLGIQFGIDPKDSRAFGQNIYQSRIALRQRLTDILFPQKQYLIHQTPVYTIFRHQHSDSIQQFKTIVHIPGNSFVYSAVTDLKTYTSTQVLLDSFDADVQIIMVNCLLAPEYKIAKIHEHLYKSLIHLFENPLEHKINLDQIMFYGYSSGSDLMFPCYIRLLKKGLKPSGAIAVNPFIDYSRHLFFKSEFDLWKQSESKDACMTFQTTKRITQLIFQDEKDLVNPIFSIFFTSDQDLKVIKNLFLFHSEIDGGRRNFQVFSKRLRELEVDIKCQILERFNHLIGTTAVFTPLSEEEKKCDKLCKLKIQYFQKLSKTIKDIWINDK